MTATVPTGNTYDKYGATNPLERGIMRRFLAALDRAVGDRSPATVLEVGAGEGEISARIARRFPSALVAGIDLPDDSLGQAWRERGLSGAYAVADRLPVASSSVDLVLAVEVLEHVDDPDAALAEIARVGRDRVVLSVPCEPLWRVGNLLRGRYLRDLGNTPGHVQHWSATGFARTVARHLGVVEVIRPLPWTLVRCRVADGEGGPW